MICEITATPHGQIHPDNARCVGSPSAIALQNRRPRNACPLPCVPTPRSPNVQVDGPELTSVMAKIAPEANANQWCREGLTRSDVDPPPHLPLTGRRRSIEDYDVCRRRGQAWDGGKRCSPPPHPEPKFVPPLSRSLRVFFSGSLLLFQAKHNKGERNK
ncbi:hypothetical protein R1flu_012347 [Riccia fluitans]|uniref:Uncharacterized protein n=1 Tax=Riccia fluitans TaxID=41844 RepID=A0ABD1ZAB8_9MARC